MDQLDNYIPFLLLPLIFIGVRKMLIKKKEYHRLKKWTLYIGMAAWFITEIVRSFIRPYVYANDIQDYFFSDTIGNSFGTMTAVFMILTLVGKSNKKDFWLILMIVVGLIGYEFTSIGSGFDQNDVFATLIFGIISALTFHLLLQSHLRKK